MKPYEKVTSGRIGDRRKWLFLFLVSTAACVMMVTCKSAPAFEFAQGVIVDPGQGIVYIMSPNGRIDAVNLSSGDAIATSTRGAKPLLLYGDGVLAQAEAEDQSGMLSLVGLSSTDLKPTFQIDVPLPSRVHASIVESLGSSFYVSARYDNDEIVVQWRSLQRRVSGVPTSEPAQIATGFARIDPTAGHLVASGGGEAPHSPSPKFNFPANVQAVMDSQSLISQLCRVDDLIAAIGYSGDNGQKHTTLRRWNKDTGQSLPNIELFDSKLTFQNFSADCRYLLFSRANDGWLWSIFATTTGNLVAELNNPSPTSQFFIWESFLVYESPAVITLDGEHKAIVQPARLQAIDLGTGRQLWARPIRETKYLGPYPGKSENP